MRSADHCFAFKRRLFITPESLSPVITVGVNYKRKMEIGHWGLTSPSGDCTTALIGSDVPKWHTMMEPPRRCLIPATSFAIGNDPTWFCFEDKQSFSLFALAGVTFRRNGKLHYLIVTTQSNQAARMYSPEMPLLLKPDEYACWLHAPWDFARELLTPYTENDLYVVNANALARTA